MTESTNSSDESPSLNPEIPPETPRPKRKYTRRTPRITDADTPPVTLPSPPHINLALEAARSVGLDPRLGFCDVLRHNGRDVFVLRYRGMARLIMESGEVSHFDAHPVFEKDDFALDLGANLLKHAPWAGEEGPGALVGAYAQIIDSRGSRQIAYLPGRQIYARSSQLFTEGMTAEEIAKKIVVLELAGNSYLSLHALRLAINAEMITGPLIDAA